MSSGRAAPACIPTWQGHIETTKDALIIFEAALQGLLGHCIRRPHDRERNALITSGNVFVYEEGTSGIKRWTDGIPWSPSRILTNFLIYRQLNSPFPPGEKKRATKRSQRPVKVGEPYAAPMPIGNGHDDGYSMTNASPTVPGLKSEEPTDKDADRVLVGSLVDSYEFKDGGLLKKTMTVTVNGVQHHLVSYYSLEDAKHRLGTPREDPRLKDLKPRDELMEQPKFKVHNYDDAGDGVFDQIDNQQTGYPYITTTNLQTMRPFTSPHGQFSPQEQSPSAYYHPYTPYPSHVNTPTSMSNASFASMPPTPSTYAPMLSSTPTGYPQYPHQTLHQHQHNTQPQPQRRSSNQPIIKAEGQSQYQNLLQQPQYQSNQQRHQLSHQEQKQPAQSFQHHSPTNTGSLRDGGGMNLYTNDPLGMSNSYFAQGVNVGGSMNDGSMVLPQPAQMPFGNQYGANYESSYYSSRATS